MKNKNKAAQKKWPTLDLHGYPGDEVIDAVDAFLLNHSRQGTKVVKIMTGKGKGVVQKIATQYLKQAGYPFKYEKLPNGKPNQGVLDVFLD